MINVIVVIRIRSFAAILLVSVAFVNMACSAKAGLYKVYRDQSCGFEFRYPSDGKLIRIASGADRVDLPFVSGTTLCDKYILINVSSGREDSPGDGLQINGMKLKFELGSEGAAGSIYDFIRCTVTFADRCQIVLTFVLHSVNPEMFDSPPPAFDRAKEVLPFWLILASLRPLPDGSSPGNYPHAGK